MGKVKDIAIELMDEERYNDDKLDDEYFYESLNKLYLSYLINIQSGRYEYDEEIKIKN